MEEENLTTLHQGTTSSGILNSSMEESFLNYQSDGGEFISEKEMMMMMMSRSRHSDFLADLQHHQDIMDRQKNAVLWSYLKENAKQAQALRQENVNLKTVNVELTNRLSLLIKATSDYATFGPSGSVVNPVLSGLSRMGLEGNAWNDVVGEGESPSPTSVMDSGRVEGNANRVVVPKSISVRSNGYLKPVQVNKQRVYVRGGKKEEQPVEVEVYNQGMFKTELCNKWQETGACPYGDHCQFAHGIQELRPILRHPRYKTEVCRMVLNGDHCPYGHRCHFRHTLTDQEKLIRSINLRSFKGLLNR